MLQFLIFENLPWIEPHSGMIFGLLLSGLILDGIELSKSTRYVYVTEGVEVGYRWKSSFDYAIEYWLMVYTCRFEVRF